LKLSGEHQLEFCLESHDNQFQCVLSVHKIQSWYKIHCASQLACAKAWCSTSEEERYLHDTICLLLTFPQNQGFSEKETMPSGGSPCIMASCPVRIVKPFEARRR